MKKGSVNLLWVLIAAICAVVVIYIIFASGTDLAKDILAGVKNFFCNTLKFC